MSAKLTEEQISQALVCDAKPRALGWINCVCLSIAGLLLLLASVLAWSTLTVGSITLAVVRPAGLVLVLDVADPGQDLILKWDAAEDKFCNPPSNSSKGRQICDKTKDIKTTMDVGQPILIFAGILFVCGAITQLAVYGCPCPCTRHGGARRVADMCGVAVAVVMLLAALGAGAAMWSTADTWLNDVVRDLLPDNPDNLIHTGSGPAGFCFVFSLISAVIGVVAASATSYYVGQTDTRLRNGTMTTKNPIASSRV